MRFLSIKTEDVTSNQRFDISKFRESVISVVNVGERISPNGLVRLATSLGANAASSDALARKLRLSFDCSNPRLKRRRSDTGGYCYEKISE